jgi:initiation factor 1A
MSGRNPRGGKAFKKAPKRVLDGNAGRQEKFGGADEDQDYARVLAMLGNRRVRALCNDGVERVLKIRGRLCQKGRNKKIIRVGDLVIYSRRDFNAPPSSDDESGDENAGAGAGDSVCDLLDRVEPENYRQVRKQPGVNAILFPTSVVGNGPPMPPGEDIFDDGVTKAIAAAVEEKEELPEPDDNAEINIDAI